MPAARRRKVPPLPTFDHLAWQEIKEPTELVTAHMTDGERTQRATVRKRVSHSKIWDNLCQGHRNAAERLNAGLRILTNGLGIKTTAYRPRLSSEKREWSDHDADLAHDYLDWIAACTESGITAQQLKAIGLALFHGESLRTAAKAGTMRRDRLMPLIWQSLDIAESMPRKKRSERPGDSSSTAQGMGGPKLPDILATARRRAVTG